MCPPCHLLGIQLDVASVKAICSSSQWCTSGGGDVRDSSGTSEGFLRVLSYSTPKSCRGFTEVTNSLGDLGDVFISYKIHQTRILLAAHVETEDWEEAAYTTQ